MNFFRHSRLLLLLFKEESKTLQLTNRFFYFTNQNSTYVNDICRKISIQTNHLLKAYFSFRLRLKTEYISCFNFATFYLVHCYVIISITLQCFIFHQAMNAYCYSSWIFSIILFSLSSLSFAYERSSFYSTFIDD